MKLFPNILFFMACLALSSITVAKESGQVIDHDFISCSILTSEHLTVLQLAQRGLSEVEALAELPFNNRNAKGRVTEVYKLIEDEGILNAYSLVNSNYARCAQLVFENKGKPATDLVEYSFYYCAGENRVRYEIILRINQSFNLDRVLSQTPDTHFDVAISYFKLIKNKGLLASFDYTANNLKACLSQI